MRLTTIAVLAAAVAQLHVFDAGGILWFSLQHSNMIGRLDPAGETFQSWPIPSGGLYAGILRHMRVSRDGKALLIHQTATNRIARVSIGN